MADSHGRKTFITNLFTLLDFLTTGIYYLDFFFKPRRDIVFICFLENLLLLQGRGCTQEGGGGQGEQWGKKEGVPLPREDINKHHLKFSEPRHCQDPGRGGQQQAPCYLLWVEMWTISPSGDVPEPLECSGVWHCLMLLPHPLVVEPEEGMPGREQRWVIEHRFGLCDPPGVAFRNWD